LQEIPRRNAAFSFLTKPRARFTCLAIPKCGKYSLAC
jgi:hypothetical protein